MEAQNLAKFAFYHSAERVVRSGAILHRGPKSPFCHSPERVVRFFVAGAALWSQLVFFPQRGACSISTPRYYTLKMLWNTRKIGSLCSTVFSWRTQLHDRITSCFQLFLDNLWFDFERCSSWTPDITSRSFCSFCQFSFDLISGSCIRPSLPMAATPRNIIKFFGLHCLWSDRTIKFAGPHCLWPDRNIKFAGPHCLWPDREAKLTCAPPDLPAYGRTGHPLWDLQS